MNAKNVKIIAVTLGDPAGVGPEVALQAINDLDDERIVPVLLGSRDFLVAHYGTLFKGYTQIEDFQVIRNSGPGKYLYTIPSVSATHKPGTGTLESARDSLVYIDTAIQLWKDKKIDAIVTGPVNKGNIVKAGTPFIGHTEYIADAIGEDKPYMLMYSSEYRVLLATTHSRLSAIPDLVTRERLLEVIHIASESSKRIDGGDVTLALCGLDPHCGDNGAIGDFDMKVTQPAITEARQNGIAVEGPFAADTVFLKQNWKKYNMVIAQYHDQGLIPFKIIAFEHGVNVTLGLSMVRTSVDHGTAFDIAGKGIAQYSSMTEAIKVAYRLVIGNSRP